MVPLLEAEPPHRRLARLTDELATTTDALRELKRAWMEKNLKAQACRQAVSTPEITHFEKMKRTLALKIQEIQTGIGEVNRELRESKAARQEGRSVKRAAEPKSGPLRNHALYDQYFVLAARNELAPSMYAAIERSAKAMLADAVKMGVEEEER